MRCVGAKHELGAQPDRIGALVVKTVQAIIIVLQSKARKFSELPYEQRRDTVPVAPEGVGIS
jgi:hypothetical protein